MFGVYIAILSDVVINSLILDLKITNCGSFSIFFSKCSSKNNPKIVLFSITEHEIRRLIHMLWFTT